MKKLQIFFPLMILLSALIAAFLCGPVSAQGQFQTLNLKPGFNFVSFTLSLSLSASELKKQNPAIEDIYLYSASSGTFLSLSEGSLTSVLPGRGYIIKSASSASIEVSGSVPASISVPALKSGFNLIGFSKTPETLTFSQLMARSAILRGLYKWSPVSGVFISVLKNNNGIIEQVSGTDPQITAGQSYFAYVSSDTVLDYSGSSIVIGDGSAVSEPSLTIPASALSDIPMPEQITGYGNIAGEIAPPSDSAAPGGPDRAIKIVSLTNIKVWIKNKPEITAQTDENGKFELKNVPAAPEGQGHTIEYEKIEGADKFNGVIKNVPVLEKKKLDLKPYIGPAVIKKAGSIQGRVALYDGLSPIGTDVYIAGVSNMFAKADEDGSFSLMYVPEGTFTIVFSMYGYEILKKEVSVRANEINQIDRVILRKVNITSTLGYIDGYVTDADGMPVPAALASLVSSDSTVDLACQTTTTGHFKFAGLNGGDYKLIIARDGYKGSETAVKLLTGEEKHVNAAMEKIENSGTGFGLICGYVRDMVTGSPIRNAVVMTIPPTEQFFTDNNGFFSFLIKAGEYTLIIKKAGYIEDRLTFKVPQDQAVEVEGLLENLDTTPVETIGLNLSELTMKQGESFQFIATLKDASGANIYGRAISWSASSSQTGRVDFTGLFNAEGPGTCEVTASYGGKSAKAKINVISTEKRLVSLSILPSRASLYVEEIKRFTLKAVYSDSETRVVLPSLAEWSCGEGLYMIEKSAFAAVSPGQWLVTAKFNGLEASAAINVIGSLADDKAPRISHKQPQIKAGSPLEIKAEVVDAGGGSVYGVSLYYKKLQDSDFKSVSMVKSTEGVYLYSIPAADITVSGIQYYITAEDDASPAHNKASFPAEGRDNPITLKPLAVTAITLSKYSDKALAGEKYDLGLVSAMVKYSDETSKPVSPVWSLSSGTGTLAAKEFVSQTIGAAVLKATYTEGGVSVSANLNISIVNPAFPAPAPNGQYWTAKVYNFNYALKNLPDFSTLPAPVSAFKTSVINVSSRSFDEGFPGTGKDVIENFAIRFTAKLKIASAGTYTFKLDSDDGSKLYINGQLVIDNDGIHSTASKTGTIQLAAGEHKTVVEYFQGPRYQIALQLFRQVNGQYAIIPDSDIIAWDGERAPVELTLSPQAAETYLSSYALSTIECGVKYNDGQIAKVLPVWSVASGDAALINGSCNLIPKMYITVYPYQRPDETVKLSASYSEAGVSKSAEFTLVFKAPKIKNLSALRLGVQSDSVAAAGIYNLSALKVFADYSDQSSAEVTAKALWVKKSGGGALNGKIFTAPLSSEVVILSASYEEGGVSKAADFSLKIEEAAVVKTVDPIGGHEYSIINRCMTWKEARAFCENMGGYLATATTQAENDYLYGIYKAADPEGVMHCWLGATDEGSEGSWKWVTGEAYNFSNWDQAQPDNGGAREHYLHFGQRFGPKWNDAANDDKNILEKGGFICEWGNPVTAKVAAPQITPDGGAFTDSQIAAISCATAGASIKYTLDGSIPTDSYGFTYTAPVTLKSSAIVRAIALKAGMAPSEVKSSVFTRRSSTADTVSGLIAYYKFDGDLNDYSGNGRHGMAHGNIQYSTGVIGNSLKLDGVSSYVRVNWHEIFRNNEFTLCAWVKVDSDASLSDTMLSVPSYSVWDDALRFAYRADSKVLQGYTYSMNYINAPENLQDRYHHVAMVKNGANLLLFCDGIQIAQKQIPVAITYGMPRSIVIGADDDTGNDGHGDANFFKGQIDELKIYGRQMSAEDISGEAKTGMELIKTARPEFTPLPGTYDSTQSVTIKCATTGAVIKYTIDGSDPSRTNGIVFSSPIKAGVPTLIKAIAYKPEMIDSETAEAYFKIEKGMKITPSPANPVPGGGTGGPGGTGGGTETEAAEEGDFYELVVIARNPDGSVKTDYSSPGKLVISSTPGVVQWEGEGVTDNSNLSSNNDGSYEASAFKDGVAHFYVRNSRAGTDLMVLITGGADYLGVTYLTWMPETPPAGLKFEGENSKGFRKYSCVNDSSVKMIKIMAGPYERGDAADPSTVKNIKMGTYYIAETPLTNLQFKTWRASAGAPALQGSWSDPGAYYDHPAVNISWNDAKHYSYWLMTGRQSAAAIDSASDSQYMPTEAQYEKAARGIKYDNWKVNDAANRIWPWGTNYTPGLYCNDYNIATPDEMNLLRGFGTTPVTKFSAQGYYGLYDIAGNVMQWMRDWTDTGGGYYSSVQADSSDPLNTSSGAYRSLRGGSWTHAEYESFSCFARYYYSPSAFNKDYGFRPALKP